MDLTDMYGDENMKWFALQVRLNFERSVSKSLKEKGYQEFTPAYRIRRKWSDRVKEMECPLFPGYVFCRFDPKFRLPILQASNVLSVVGYGGQPVPISESEIISLQILVNNSCKPIPWPYLRVGQKVRVIGGALDGLEGLVQNFRSARRIIVSLHLLQRSVAAELEREHIEPVV
jgi:transcription antitermination factor NusG